MKKAEWYQLTPTPVGLRLFIWVWLQTNLLKTYASTGTSRPTKAAIPINTSFPTPSINPVGFKGKVLVIVTIKVVEVLLRSPTFQRVGKV